MQQPLAVNCLPSVVNFQYFIVALVADRGRDSLGARQKLCVGAEVWELAREVAGECVEKAQKVCKSARGG